MSILLESLNQFTDHSPNKGVPSVDDSHFDDEMLSDEWVLKKLFYWKIVSAILLVALLASWTSFYFYSPSFKNKLNHPISKLEEQAPVSETQKQQDNTIDNEKVAKPEKEISSEHVVAEKLIETAEVANAPQRTLDQLKQKYQPKKIEKSIGNAPVEKSIVKNKLQQKDLSQNGQVTEFDSLTEAERQELPELEISSYAVSSNPDKSFVVLNGSFYGQGEAIAPHLVLISIDKEGILVRYKGRLISKKYSL